MKKIILNCVLVFIATAVFSQASVKEITGKVEVRNSGGEWTTATVGMAIPKNGEISTSFRSMAVLAVGNSVVTVKPLTRLSIEDLSLSGSAENVRLNMPAGRIQASVAPPEGGTTNFSVKSPQATASVLGTSFAFDGNTTTVTEGQVAIRSTDGQVSEVSPGERLAATPAEMNSGAAVQLVQNTFTLPSAGSRPDSNQPAEPPVVRKQLVDITIQITFPE